MRGAQASEILPEVNAADLFEQGGQVAFRQEEFPGKDLQAYLHVSHGVLGNVQRGFYLRCRASARFIGRLFSADASK